MIPSMHFFRQAGYGIHPAAAVPEAEERAQSHRHGQQRRHGGDDRGPALFRRLRSLDRSRPRHLHGDLVLDGVQELCRRLEPVLRLHGQTFQNSPVQPLRNLDPRLGHRHQFVLVQPLQTLRRQYAGQGRVQARGAGVHIGVRSLPPSPYVLLLGRVAHLQDNVQALALVPDGVPGGAEVQQLDVAVL